MLEEASSWFYFFSSSSICFQCTLLLALSPFLVCVCLPLSLSLPHTQRPCWPSKLNTRNTIRMHVYSPLLCMREEKRAKKERKKNKISVKHIDTWDTWGESVHVQYYLSSVSRSKYNILVMPFFLSSFMLMFPLSLPHRAMRQTLRREVILVDHATQEHWRAIYSLSLFDKFHIHQILHETHSRSLCLSISLALSVPPPPPPPPSARANPCLSQSASSRFTFFHCIDSP